ncbi:LysR family transcriptional regulator [Curvibacter sp. CHRR-16]|nr:LysR family transcriptional regulator [Curvibacter sp. CHRR-16]
MRFNKLDLNLLVALDALLTERNISRAGQRIHLSQPATSNALARLRDYFQDELLIPRGRQLILSTRAQELVEPVREILMRIDSTIATQPTFEPSETMRKFVLLLSDYSASVYIPSLIASMYKLAPQSGLEMRSLNERPLEQLEKNEVDLLIIPSQYVSSAHPSKPLFEEQYMCVTWKGNTRIQNQLTFDDYIEAGHIAGDYSVNHQHAPAFDSWFLERFGVKRRVEVTAPTLTALPQMVVGTNRIATVHRRIALQAEKTLPVAIWTPPIEIPTMIQTLQWHKHRDGDPAMQWLIAEALRVGKTI